MVKNERKILLTVFISTVIFFVLLVTDVIPLLRGYPDKNLSSQFPYYFINTLDKLWLPLLVLLGMVTFFHFRNKFIFKNRSYLYLTFFILAVFIFQLSLVYFSRFGITVLFRRIAEPSINGYFTAAKDIKSTSVFLKEFPENNFKLSQHAPTHPPGGIVTEKLIIEVFRKNTNLTDFTYSKIRAPVTDAGKLWNTLTKAERVSAIFIGFLLHFIAALTIIPLYLLARNLKNDDFAKKTVFFYSVIPSFSFFAPFFDPFYAFFGILGFYLIIKSIKINSDFLLFLSGISFVIGASFSLSVLPIIGCCLIFLLLTFKLQAIKKILLIISGIIFSAFMIFLMGLNLIETYFATTNAAGHMAREFIPTLFFNPLEFFIFLGLPISILLFILTYYLVFKKVKFDLNFKNIVFSFWIIIILLTLSGATRGEVGRIWGTLMFIPVILSVYLLDKLKTKNINYIIIFALIAIQTLIMEEFWVPVW